MSRKQLSWSMPYCNHYYTNRMKKSRVVSAVNSNKRSNASEEIILKVSRMHLGLKTSVKRKTLISKLQFSLYLVPYVQETAVGLIHRSQADIHGYWVSVFNQIH